MEDSKGNARGSDCETETKGGKDIKLGGKTFYRFWVNGLAFLNDHFRCNMEIYCKGSKIGGQGTS